MEFGIHMEIGRCALAKSFQLTWAAVSQFDQHNKVKVENAIHLKTQDNYETNIIL